MLNVLYICIVYMLCLNELVIEMNKSLGFRKNLVQETVKRMLYSLTSGEK